MASACAPWTRTRDASTNTRQLWTRRGILLIYFAFKPQQSHLHAVCSQLATQCNWQRRQNAIPPKIPIFLPIDYQPFPNQPPLARLKLKSVSRETNQKDTTMKNKFHPSRHAPHGRTNNNRRRQTSRHARRHYSVPIGNR